MNWFCKEAWQVVCQMPGLVEVAPHQCLLELGSASTASPPLVMDFLRNLDLP